MEEGGERRRIRSRREASTREEKEAPAEAPRIVKRDPESSSRSRQERRERGETSGGGGGSRQDVMDRRVLRSKYLAVKNLINDERENISGQVSDKFNSIIGEVENLHHLVQKPREQVADAEALLDIASTIVASLKSQSNDGITPSDFITSLLREFPPQTAELTTENLRDSVLWGEIGHSASHILRNVHGCSTMIGPMNVELKQRKAVVQRKRVRQAESSRPEELDDKGAEERTDTDKNMATMFNILRKKKSIWLEHLILNRNSFAQTVENLFALSFLVKDGRVEITMDDDNHHLVSPRNAPAATAVASGDVTYSHFVFRLDFKDWKLMMDYVRNGEELMPHRTEANISSDSHGDRGEQVHVDSQTTVPTTPIRKLCRNRGLVIQEESVVEDSPESDNVTDQANAIRKGKRKIM